MLLRILAIGVIYDEHFRFSRALLHFSIFLDVIAGMSENTTDTLFSFEPTPEYLSEKLKRPGKASTGVFSAEKAVRRTSQDKREGASAGATRARAESASIGRSKWDNAEETQVRVLCFGI
jgi:hypothetical protein